MPQGPGVRSGSCLTLGTYPAARPLSHPAEGALFLGLRRRRCLRPPGLCPRGWPLSLMLPMAGPWGPCHDLVPKLPPQPHPGEGDPWASLSSRRRSCRDITFAPDASLGPVSGAAHLRLREAVTGATCRLHRLGGRLTPPRQGPGLSALHALKAEKASVSLQALGCLLPLPGVSPVSPSSCSDLRVEVGPALVLSQPGQVCTPSGQH